MRAAAIGSVTPCGAWASSPRTTATPRPPRPPPPAREVQIGPPCPPRGARPARKPPLPAGAPPVATPAVAWGAGSAPRASRAPSSGSTRRAALSSTAGHNSNSYDSTMIEEYHMNCTMSVARPRPARGRRAAAEAIHSTMATSLLHSVVSFTSTSNEVCSLSCGQSFVHCRESATPLRRWRTTTEASLPRRTRGACRRCCRAACGASSFVLFVTSLIRTPLK